MFFLLSANVFIPSGTCSFTVFTLLNKYLHPPFFFYEVIFSFLFIFQSALSRSAALPLCRFSPRDGWAHRHGRTAPPCGWLRFDFFSLWLKYYFVNTCLFVFLKHRSEEIATRGLRPCGCSNDNDQTSLRPRDILKSTFGIWTCLLLINIYVFYCHYSAFCLFLCFSWLSVKPFKLKYFEYNYISYHYLIFNNFYC